MWKEEEEMDLKEEEKRKSKVMEAEIQRLWAQSSKKYLRYYVRWRA